MSDYQPRTYNDLRKDIATTAWGLWTPTRPLPQVPTEFYTIADYAIQTVKENVDRIISEMIKEKLEDHINKKLDDGECQRKD
ncbi:MAG: hypothetical protein P8Y72_01935 [Anaerolineales bacterium]|jgi:hypothetical protein